jgi:hypothetical protein
LEHVVDETSKLAVAGSAEKCGVGSNAEERIAVRALDDCDTGSSKAVKSARRACEISSARPASVRGWHNEADWIGLTAGVTAKLKRSAMDGTAN